MWLVLTRSTVWGEGEVSAAPNKCAQKKISVALLSPVLLLIDRCLSLSHQAIGGCCLIDGWLIRTSRLHQRHTFWISLHLWRRLVTIQLRTSLLLSSLLMWVFVFCSTREDEQCFWSNSDHLSLQEIKSFSCLSAHCLLFHECITISFRSQNLKCSVGGG